MKNIPELPGLRGGFALDCFQTSFQAGHVHFAPGTKAARSPTVRRVDVARRQNTLSPNIIQDSFPSHEVLAA